MSENLRRFVARAPRYVLRPQDRNIMRFSLEHTIGQGGIEQTILINLSETGVAFLVNPGHEPSLGERMKVEVPIPNGEQIAWWARVVRIQIYEHSGWLFKKDPFHGESKVLVGLRFEAMPEPHSRMIRRGLEKSFLQAMRDQQFRNWQYYRTLFSQSTARFVLYFLLTAFTIGFIYYFSRPDSNYDAKRGSQWGDRFKF